MEVTIQQAVSSPPSEYEIETPACFYHATKKCLSLHGKVQLFAPQDRLVATILGTPHQYDLRPNDDANPVAILRMALAIDVTESEGCNSSITYDLGNVGPEEMPFDQSGCQAEFANHQAIAH